MRVNPPGYEKRSGSSQVTGAQASQAKEAAGQPVKKQAERAGGVDPMTLSPEAMLKYGQARLEAHVHDRLQEQFAAAGIELDAAQGQDWSPDATAHRIVDFASGLIGAYRNHHPELSESEVVDKFGALVRGAVDKGYGQATKVLSGMGASDEILGTAKTTIDKVHRLFDEFFAGLRGQPTPNADGTSGSPA